MSEAEARTCLRDPSKAALNTRGPGLHPSSSWAAGGEVPWAEESIGLCREVSPAFPTWSHPLLALRHHVSGSLPQPGG